MNEQFLLFAMTPDPNPCDERRPLPHRGDSKRGPNTAEHIRQSANLAAQQEAVLQALRQCDGATHAELGKSMGIHWLTPARRLPELERLGLVKKGEPRICMVKRSRCTTWWIVEGDV